MTRGALALALLLAACQTSSHAPLPPDAGGDPPPVTFNNQVVRIFQRHCQACHRHGEAAPFSLTTWADAHARRDDIREAVTPRPARPSSTSSTPASRWSNPCPLDRPAAIASGGATAFGVA
jgi:hypothetical protein